jgi:shikimate kinase
MVSTRMTARSGNPLPGMRHASAQAVFLVGFMGSGKSLVGRALADRLGWGFVDLDAAIEQRAGCTVAEIFRDRGEPEFRSLEHLAIVQVLTELHRGGTVVALGGGAWMDTKNANLIASGGWPAVFLDAPVDVLWERCAPDRAQRPLLASEAAFRELYERRRPRYMMGTQRFETQDRTADAVAIEIAEWLAGKTSLVAGG